MRCPHCHKPISGKTISGPLQALRMEKGLRQKEVAARMGVRQSTVSRMETDTTRSAGRFLKAYFDAVEATPAEREILCQTLFGSP